MTQSAELITYKYLADIAILTGLDSQSRQLLAMAYVERLVAVLNQATQGQLPAFCRSLENLIRNDVCGEFADKFFAILENGVNTSGIHSSAAKEILSMWRRLIDRESSNAKAYDTLFELRLPTPTNLCSLNSFRSAVLAVLSGKADAKQKVDECLNEVLDEVIPYPHLFETWVDVFNKMQDIIPHLSRKTSTFTTARHPISPAKSTLLQRKRALLNLFRLFVVASVIAVALLGFVLFKKTHPPTGTVKGDLRKPVSIERPNFPKLLTADIPKTVPAPPREKNVAQENSEVKSSSLPVTPPLKLSEEAPSKETASPNGLNLSLQYKHRPSEQKQSEITKSSQPLTPVTSVAVPLTNTDTAEKQNHKSVTAQEDKTTDIHRDDSNQATTDATLSNIPIDQVNKPVDRVAKDGTYYIARIGDTLFYIAHRFYGDGNKWNLIQEANRTIVPQPLNLKVGMQLVIPNQEGDEVRTKNVDSNAVVLNTLPDKPSQNTENLQQQADTAKTQQRPTPVESSNLEVKSFKNLALLAKRDYEQMLARCNTTKLETYCPETFRTVKSIKAKAGESWSAGFASEREGNSVLAVQQWKQTESFYKQAQEAIKTAPDEVKRAINSLLDHKEYLQAVQQMTNSLLPACESLGELYTWTDLEVYLKSCIEKHPLIKQAGAMQISNLQILIKQRTQEELEWREITRKLKSLERSTPLETLNAKIQILDDYISKKGISYYNETANNYKSELMDDKAILEQRNRE